MPTFTVLAAAKIKDGQGTKGPFTVWKLSLKNGEGGENVAEIFCPFGMQPPAVGSTVDGTIEKTDNPSWLDKFKPTRTGGSQRNDPKVQAAIIRQHSQTAALKVLELKQQLGVLAADELTTKNLRTLADWFDDDVKHGVNRAGA
jgi:hypothetical protein